MASPISPATKEGLPCVKQKQRLSTQMLNKYVASKFDDSDSEFLPHGCIDDLVTLESIVEELSENRQSKPEDLESQERSAIREITDFVLNHDAKKVFAITILCQLRGEELETAIRQFIKIPLTDSRLPVNKGYLMGHSSDTASLWHKLRDNDFYHYQWGFLAPVFSPSNYIFDLQANHVMPFVEIYNDTKDKDTGGSSQVFKIKIHEAHNKYPLLNVSILSILC
jgi:hypothetical protein